MKRIEVRPAIFPKHAREGAGPSVLREIAERSVAIAIWRRVVPRALARGLVALDLSAICSIRFFATLDNVETAMLDALGAIPASTATLLAADVAALASLLIDVMGRSLLEVRLEHVKGDACRKFHADYVTARLITTYIGQGTQWRGDDDPAGAPTEPEKLPFIRQLGAGDVGLFKGLLLNDGAAIIHRSPPIAGSGEERLVLVITPSEVDRA